MRRTAPPPWVVGLFILALSSAVPDARGNIIITLAAADADGNPIEIAAMSPITAR